MERSYMVSPCPVHSSRGSCQASLPWQQGQSLCGPLSCSHPSQEVMAATIPNHRGNFRVWAGLRSSQGPRSDALSVSHSCLALGFPSLDLNLLTVARVPQTHCKDCPMSQASSACAEPRVISCKPCMVPERAFIPSHVLSSRLQHL